MSLETESTVLEVSLNSSFTLEGFQQLDERGQTLVEAAIGRLNDSFPLPPVRVHLIKTIPQHVGLGSRTATILGVLKATCLASGATIPTTDLQRLSGRGGASGVGIHAFFTGGLVVDSGRKRGPDSQLLPSGAQLNLTRPNMSVCIQVPNSWVCWLMLPDGAHRHGETEITFFRENTPIPDKEVLKALASTYHGLVPAVAEADILAFASSLKELQSIGFKRREIEGQTRQVNNLLADLWHIPGAASGMSSMGPVVFSLFEGQDQATRVQVEDLCKKHAVRILGSAKAANNGHKVEPIQ